MRYSVAVIGGGPGGYVAAIRAAQLGLKTVLFEREHLGGVCLNKGCIPTKALLHMSGLCWEMAHAGEMGVMPGGAVDLAKMRAHKNSIVRQLSGGVASLLKSNGVEVVGENARLASPGRVEVGGRAWEADNVILAMGARPIMPEGAEGKALDSDGFLEMEKLPKDAVIVGGGVIGVEFAQILSELGCGVTVLESMGRLLPAADEDMSELAAEILKGRGARILCGVRVTEYGRDYVRFTAGGSTERLEAELVLACTGRKADIAGMERLGVRTQNGKIKVNGYMQTSLSHVYAIGDLTDGPMLAHKASAEGIIAAEHIAGGSRAMRYGRIPQCVYTTPELAWAGMSLSEARRRDDVNVFTFPMSHNGRSLTEGAADGFARLLSHKGTGEILGAQLACAHASELIGAILAAMQAEACIEDVAELILPHPSVSEAIMEAASGICGRGIHSITG